MNEEEVKIKYVLPWLKQAGINLQDLQFERTFYVKIGRQSLLIDGSRAEARVRARLDILVRRDDKNLFIVETKAAGEALTDDDRDQAVSYARLVHPIAPYAVVTNGHECRLYDSVSKEQIDPAQIRVGGFEVTLPESATLEAQKVFLGLSRSNLLAFCEQQTASELRLVRGTLSEGRKYVAQLHVPRESIRKEVADLYQSALPGLLLVAESGSGKTCELCSIVESLAATRRPVLFFNGFSLASNILDAIASEFSWTFSGSDTAIQIIKRVESIVRNDFLTIVVDGIDEWTHEFRSNHLGVLLRAAEHRRIRVILSCKTSSVDSFLSHRGNPTYVSILAKRVEMPGLSAREFFEAIDAYRHVYEFYGGFEDAVLKQAQENPFLLRVIFDVAKGSNLKHITFSSAQFFEVYYARLLDKTHDPREAAETTRVVARLLYERNAGWISERDVRKSLGLRINESLMEELFEYGFLVRSGEKPGEGLIGFYFQQLRDYIIAFKELQFNKMAAPNLKSEIDATTFPSTKGDAFTLYYRLAPMEHKLLFDSELRNNAAQYLRCYELLIQEHFPAIKAALSPCTDKRIGFVGELVLSDRHVGLHGFRPLEEGDEEVHFIPMQRGLNESNLPHLAGAGAMHYTTSSLGFRNGIDVRREVVTYELLPQIRELVGKGELNESNNPDLLCELVVESIRMHTRIFKPLLTADHRSVCFPLKLQAVLDCILREKLIRHFQDEIVRRKRKDGDIREHWRGSIVSFSYSRTPTDEAEAVRKADLALSVGEIPNVRTRYQELEALEKRLRPAINILRRIKDEITAPRFGDFDRLGDLSPRYGSSVSEHALKEYLRRLYAAFLSNYRDLIDTNFPTLRSYFKLYSQPASRFFFVLGSPIERDADVRLSVYTVKSDSGEDVVEFPDEVVRESAGNGDLYTIGGTVLETVSRLQTSVRSFVEDNGRFGQMHLRAMVYAQVRRELSAVEGAFWRHVGL